MNYRLVFTRSKEIYELYTLLGLEKRCLLLFAKKAVPLHSIS